MFSVKPQSNSVCNASIIMLNNGQKELTISFSTLNEKERENIITLAFHKRIWSHLNPDLPKFCLIKFDFNLDY